MDTTLATVTIISLLLAWAMAIVARQRIRSERRRSEARLATLMAEYAKGLVRGDEPMERPAGCRELAAAGPAASGRRDAMRGFAAAPREPEATNAPTRRRERGPLAPRLPVAAPDRTRRGEDAPARLTAAGGAIARRCAADGEPSRGLAARCWSHVRRAVLAPLCPAPAPWGHRAVAVAVATVLVAGVSLAERTSMPRGGADLPVELLSLEHRRQGSYLAVSGTLRNPPGARERSRVSISATVFDRAGAIIGSGQTPLPAAALPPGRETAFTISLPNAARIDRYRVSFMEDRSRLPHVDRRGPDPAAGGDPAAGT